MRLRKNLGLSLLLVLFCLPALLRAGAIDFIKGDLAGAQQRSAQEGKLTIAVFTASWCAPCRWMKEDTFTDPALAEYVDDNYVAVEIDIDDFDGYNLRDEYAVTVLPTIILFNSKGRVVQRYEQTFTPAELRQELQKYDLPANRVRSAAPAPAAPAVASSPPPAPALTPKPKPAPETSPKPSAPIFAPLSPAPAEERNGQLYRFTVIRQAASGHSVQAGFFSDYRLLLEMAEKLHKAFPDQPIIVHAATIGTKDHFRIFVGKFDTPSEANKLMGQVKGRGIEAFVRDLSTL